MLLRGSATGHRPLQLEISLPWAQALRRKPWLMADNFAPNQFDYSEPLALHGGPKAKRTPFPPRKRHGELEKRYLAEVIDSDVLFYFLGTKVFEFQKRFAAMYGRKHCIACSSGTAAVHIALGALELPPGSEVITSAVTDMGSLTGMLYQGLVPVFADLDPATLNMDPASARRCITPRTGDRKSTRLNSSHSRVSRMPSSA